MNIFFNLNGLMKSYKNTTVINGEELDIKRGSIFALPGPKNLLIFIIMTILTIIFVSCSTGNNVPQKGSNPNIDDGEYLFYKGFNGGDNIYNWTLISRYENNPKWGKIVYIYEYIQYLSYGEKQIADYKNFPDWYQISLSLCSSVAMHKDFHYLETNNNYKGPLSMDYLYDDKSSMIHYTEVDRVNGVNGTKKSRIPIKKGYPFGDSSSSIFLPRFLDINDNGTSYIFIPLLLKETIPFTIHVLGS